jgi:uncharacterized iron-regulated membrane protein
MPKDAMNQFMQIAWIVGGILVAGILIPAVWTWQQKRREARAQAALKEAEKHHQALMKGLKR